MVKNNNSNGAGRITPKALIRNKGMKRFGNLYDRICAYDNICMAYEKAWKGKGKSRGVIMFEKNLHRNLLSIQTDLATRAYQTPGYDIFTIYDPKERIIYRLPFRDRIVHHAIMNILEPLWVSVFISHSYSCIKGKGIHGVMKHLKRDMKDSRGTVYCLKMDIRKFYPSIDHDVMKTIIRKKIKDVCLLKLLDNIIDSAPGLPIGNYLSQYLANLYLSYFDHWMKENKQVKYYYRYADDLVILSDNKEYLWSLFRDMEDYLRDRLKLQVKDNYQVFPVSSRGIDFVGYVFYHTHTLLRKSIKQNFCRRAAKLNKMTLTPKEYRIQICPWLGWSKHCDSKHLVRKIMPYEKVC